jgi:hypothetical protein
VSNPALDRDRNRCLRLLRQREGKPVSLGALAEAVGHPLDPQGAIKVLTAVKGVTYKRHKGKHYFTAAYRALAERLPSMEELHQGAAAENVVEEAETSSKILSNEKE